MARCVVPEADNILDKEYKVLDKGFVRLVDYLGCDERIVQAARVSYGAGTKSYREDRGLIDYLLRNGHTSPFEQVVLTFHVKMPIFVARQWVRHRTGRLNEISGRYSVMEEEFYVPEEEHLRLQSRDNKQARSEEQLDSKSQEEVRSLIEGQQHDIYGGYESLLKLGLAREVSRINLPLSLYTQWYWQMDLHNLFHFLRLRMHPHAQLEIRKYAEQIWELVKIVTPMAAESFENHVLGGESFSAKELEELRKMSRGESCSLSGKARTRFFDKLGLEDDSH